MYNKLWDSEIKYVIDGWASAKLGLEDLVTDKFGYKVRLLTLGELTDNLGYTLKNGETSYSFTKDISPDWIYNNSFSYWTMSRYEDSNSSICIVSYDGNIFNRNVSDYRENTVRPVINLKKESIKKETLQEIKTIDSKVFKIGDILEYNGIKFYAIENSDESKKTVALLKAEPLTVDEVNKYGKGYINKDTENKEAMDINGYGSVAYYSSDTCKDYNENNTGCTSEYSKSDVKYVLDNWALETLKDFPLIEDDLGYKVRLITLNELVNNLNFSANSNGIYYASEQTPSFVYSKLYRYLTMSPTDVSNSSVYTVADSLNANVSSALPTVGGYTTFTGVIRPVIILDKTGGIVSDIVSVPDTFLTKPLIFIGIGLLIIIISITIAFVIFKKQKRINN